MKPDTAARMPPMRHDPMASGTCEPKQEVRPMQPRATVTPITAAMSSSSTTFTLGSWPRNTVEDHIHWYPHNGRTSSPYSMKLICWCRAPLRIACTAISSVPPSVISEPPRM
ncbi:hypothetical protein E2C01_000811 [Portunus trituberculatus]|uniref:Uncharacterized protein n=1 Tax=Portunus trituberculatus TaxID=210409 RepID=A0A5B7CG15_PORTR|nr:hypothetical protein [Portunus trituberculatus]